MGDAVYAFNVTATVLTVIEGRQDQRITGIVVLVVFQLALLNKQTTNTGHVQSQHSLEAREFKHSLN